LAAGAVRSIEVARRHVLPSPDGGVRRTSESANDQAVAASPSPTETGTPAERTLDEFMDARMSRSSAVAIGYLSAAAHDVICDDRFCTMLVGTSNPHYASWEVVSETDEAHDIVVFVVRIREETTGEEHTDDVQESIEIGPGENFQGEHMDAVVLELTR
jgi:hypothetical protein